VPSTRFELPNVHPQEDLYMQFYGISFMQPHKQSGRRQDILHQENPDIDQTAYIVARKKYHKTACTSLPED
jgi:hypothetical protein